MKTAAGRMLAAAVAAALLWAPAASASIAPSLSLDQSAGTQAGSTVSLGTDLKFAPSSGDSPKDLTLTLPPGLLADASIDGGACLTSSTPTSACQVGTGTVSAMTLGLVPVSLPVSFDLVAPPEAGDLAGLQLLTGLAPLQTALGSPGEVTVRPDGGLDIKFTDMPNDLAGLPVSVDELQTTLTGMRLPTSCPSTPAQIRVSADSYNDPTTRHAGAPLADTGCSSLPFTPGFTVSAVRDAADSGVQVTTDVTQPASPPQATSRVVVLTLPGSVLAPDVLAVLNGGILCANPASGTCKSIGTASSTSPLYPKTLTGKAYLTGTLLAPGITLIFPPPFALALTGSVDVATGSTTFQGLPDIPLTDLKVQLAGGPDSAFVATCNPASGVASSTLTTQAGDRTLTVSDPFTVLGCPASQGAGGGSGGGGGGAGGGGGGGSSGHAHPGRPHVLWATLRHVAHGSPVLSLRLVAGKAAPGLRALTITLPRGLRFLVGRGHRRAVSVRTLGARVAKVRAGRGWILILLRRSASAVTLQVRGLGESAGFARAAHRHRLKRSRVGLEVVDAAGLPTVLHPLVSLLRF